MNASINFQATGMRIVDGVVCFEGHHATKASEGEARRLAQELIPWRKGPFKLGDLMIDGEWRSDKKWDRLESEKLQLKGKVVADVGCNNGYYLFLIADAGAREVIGFDPTIKYKQQYDLIAAHAPALPVEFRLAGWQALTALPGYFDAIFLMGINYHDPNPLEIFHACKTALKPGGVLICESVVVDAPAHLEIFPSGKYAGIGGVYAIPTATALMQQLGFAGFTQVKLQHTVKMTADEQRATEFSPQKSFADFTGDGQRKDQGNSVAIPQGADSSASMRLRYPPLHRAALLAYKP